MAEDQLYFLHPIFGPWSLQGTEEAAATLAEERPFINFFYAPVGSEFWAKVEG